MAMKSFVVGFIFNTTLTRVALVTKTHPEWQKGRINGVGGKIEDGETPEAAMVREAHEEAGIETVVSDWWEVVTMQRPNVEVYFFACTVADEGMIRSMTEEQVAWYDVQTLPTNVINNLRWMIPLAIDRRSDGTVAEVVITHSADNA